MAAHSRHGSHDPAPAGAILMCEEADLSAPELRALCGQIVAAQRTEIAQMQELLDQQ